MAIAIIALLVAMLTPSLRQARELARQAVCRGNLHQLGVMAACHTSDYASWFPQTYHLHNSLMGCPSFWDADSDASNPDLDTSWLSWDQPLHPGWNQWKRNGTPWQTWIGYGMTGSTVSCPSATDRNLWGWHEGPPPRFYDGSASMTVWGKLYYVSYPWLPGLQISLWGTPHSDGDGGYNAAGKTLKPARKASDDGASSRLLAVDDVYWSGPASWGGQNYSINHAASGEPTRPAYQGLLFADGHVEGKGDGYYAYGVDALTDFGFEHGGGGRGRWYWEP